MLLGVLKQNDTGYQIVYLLHILTMVAAFAGAMVNPRLGSVVKRSDAGTARSIGAYMAATLSTMHLPALVLSGVFGIGLIGMSSDAYEFSQTWISVAFLLWFALIAVFFFALLPAQRALAQNPSEDVSKKLAMYNGIVHVLFLLMMLDMVFKPGV